MFNNCMLKRDNFMLSMENSKDVIIIRSGIMIGEMEKKSIYNNWYIY